MIKIEASPLSGAALISQERVRQMTVEGWHPTHDDQHSEEELAVAAAALITAEWSVGRVSWPWDDGWNPKDRLSNLVRAGALIAAEIDRMQRLAQH